MNIVQPHDRGRVCLLIDASIRAYRAFSGAPVSTAPPDGYEFVTTWSGVDALFGKDKHAETYGIVFRSLEKPNRYVFAFRGTASPEDFGLDLGCRGHAFVPFGPSASGPGGTVPGVPVDVSVEAGFWDAYTTATVTTVSMQRQVFALLDSYAAPGRRVAIELWITGHSLGAALSTLFALDVALCRPEIKASHVNFASPRVGNQAFVEFYQQQRAQQDATTRTLRVQNVCDEVPNLPPRELGYQHVSDVMFVEFHKHRALLSDIEWLVHCHASANYQAVLQCAKESPDGVCDNPALQVPGETCALSSTPVDPSKAKDKARG
jgi:triacylglycerol lipase